MRRWYSHLTPGRPSAPLMSDVTLIISQIERGDPIAAERLLPLVYDELRRLAAARLKQEQPGQTLQATDLVHEAYLRLIGSDKDALPSWNSRGHFFGAAAETMRRILIEHARRRGRAKHGGGRQREDLSPSEVAAPEVAEELLALDDSLERLAKIDPQSADIVKLRYFAGLTISQAAEVLGVSPRKADSLWSYARAWLRSDMNER